MSSCIVYTSTLSATSFLIGSVALFDCTAREIAPILVKFRVFQGITMLMLLIRDVTNGIEVTYLPGTVSHLHVLLGLIAIVYLLENFIEVLCKIDMVSKPMRLLVFWKYFRVFIGLFVMANLIAFLVSPTQVMDIGRYVALVLLSVFCLAPVAFLSGKIAWILSGHIQNMGQTGSDPLPLHDEKMKRFKKARRQCIMFCVALSLFTPFNAYAAVKNIVSLAQDPSALWTYRSCIISERYDYLIVHAIYWLGYYLTRSPHSKRRRWFNKFFPKSGSSDDTSSTRHHSKNGTFSSSTAYTTTRSSSTNVEASRERVELERLSRVPTKTFSTPSVAPRQSQSDHPTHLLHVIAPDSRDINLTVPDVDASADSPSPV